MITLDSFATSDGSDTSGGTNPFSFNNAGGNFLLVACMMDNTTDTVDGAVVFYNGVNLTELYNDTVDATRLYVGYLSSPSLGSHNLTLNFTGSMTVFRTFAYTFSGVSSLPIGNSASTKNHNVGTTTNMSVDVPATGQTGVVVDFIHGTRTNNGDGNAKAPQTQEAKLTDTWGSLGHIGGTSYVAHGASTTTMEWENLLFNSSAADQIMYAVELLPTPVSQVLIL